MANEDVRVRLEIPGRPPVEGSLADIGAAAGVILASKLRGKRGQGSNEQAAPPDEDEDDDAGQGAREWSRYIPAAVAFMGSEFVESEELKVLAFDLVGRYPELAHLADYELRVLWKAEGGEKGGRATLGKCVKPGGIAHYFALCDWVILLSADQCRDRKFDDTQVEALLYHELKHCVLVGKESKPGTQGHDFELFSDELRRYGFWGATQREAKQAVQLRLAFEARP